MQRSTTKLHGFTALELIIVLVVGFSIIALSASKMGQLFSSSSTTSAMSSILELYTSARSLRGPAGYGNETTNLLDVLIKTNMIPKSLALVGDQGAEKKLYNEWNGVITIMGVKGAVGFDLVYPNVPPDACLKLIQSLMGSGNFLAIKIGGNNVNSTTSLTEIAGFCVAKENKLTFEARD